MAHDELQFGEEPAHFVHVLHLLGKERHARAGNTDVDANGNIEVRADRVEQVHLLVVDRHLRVGTARKHAHGADAELAMQAADIAHLIHAKVRVDGVIEDEAVGVLAFRRHRGL